VRTPIPKGEAEVPGSKHEAEESTKEKAQTEASRKSRCLGDSSRERTSIPRRMSYRGMTIEGGEGRKGEAGFAE